MPPPLPPPSPSVLSPARDNQALSPYTKYACGHGRVEDEYRGCTTSPGRSDGAITTTTNTTTTTPTRAPSSSHDVKRRPPLFILLLVYLQVQLLFALNTVLAKPAFKYIPPMALSLWRLIFAIPPLFLLALKEGKLKNFTYHDHPMLALIGFLAVSVLLACMFFADHYSGPSIVAIIEPAIPAFTVLFAAAMKMETVTKLKGLGIILSMTGALVILRPDQMSFGDSVFIGAILMIISTMSYALALVLLKMKMITHPHPMAITAYISLWGFLFLALVGYPTGLAKFDMKATPLSMWGVALFCGLGSAFWATVCQSWALQYTSPSLPAFFSSLLPFMTCLLSYLILGDTKIRKMDFVGLALNISGLLFVVYGRSREEYGGVAPKDQPRQKEKLQELTTSVESSMGEEEEEEEEGVV